MMPTQVKQALRQGIVEIVATGNLIRTMSEKHRPPFLIGLVPSLLREPLS